MMSSLQDEYLITLIGRVETPTFGHETISTMNPQRNTTAPYKIKKKSKYDN